MYINRKENVPYWVFDIETDGLEATRVWVACFANVYTDEVYTFYSYDKIRNFVDAELQKGAIFVGHNIIGFDVPVLNSLLATRIGISRCVDTFLLSMLFNPSLEGGHSLEAWGKRLKVHKGDFKGPWDAISKEMVSYCRQDVKVTKLLFKKLSLRMRSIGFTDRGIELEHRSWTIIKKQIKNGFAFNYEEASKLYSLLRFEENKLKDEIHEYWPPILGEVAVYAKARKKDGNFTSTYLRHKEQYPLLTICDDGSYRANDYICFDIGSPKQRVEKLLELGWVPEEFTKKGNPQPTVKGSLSPSLEAFVKANDKPEVRLIATWININSRANMINTWMEAYNPKTGCIHGQLFLANTLRFRHSAPNSANIPAVRSNKDGPIFGFDGSYTYESRDLWTTRSLKRRLVGVDAKGIQLRVLAHYLNNPDFIKEVLNGDPHSYNQKIGGFRERSTAKTFIYAYLLGCGDAKAGQIIGGTTKDGKEIKLRFINNFPGLRELLARLGREMERTGRITLCDGTPVIVPSPHMVLGYLLQGDESRIMKQALIYLDEIVCKEKLDALKVCDVHDEWQWDVNEDHVDRFVEAALDCFIRAGETFNYNLPIEGDAKVGLTWAETH